MKIAWIGVGNLASPIVRRLTAAGHRPVLYDPRAPQGFDADIAGSAAEAAGAADAVFTTLPNDEILERVAAQILPAMRPGTVYCDMSTVSPRASMNVAAAAGAVLYLRAPVSGSVTHAEKGILTVIASGPRDAFDTLVPVFEHFSSGRFHVGDADEARVLKLMVNNLVGSTAALLAESLTMGEKAGLNWDMMVEVITSSAAASPLVKFKEAMMKTRDFTPAFTTALMVKDMTLVAETGAQMGCPTPLADATLALMKEHAAAGGADEDFFAVVKTTERKAGL